LVEDLRIGAVDGGGPDMFGRIVGLEVGGDGRIYVLDAQARELRIFDSGGVHRRTVGREGQGPGEFRSVYGMDWDPQGRLWIIDGGNQRYALLDGDGNELDHIPRRVGVGTTQWLGSIDDDGALWDFTRPDPGVGLSTGVARFTSDGTLLGSVRLPWDLSAMYRDTVPGGGAFTVAVPLSSFPSWTPDGDGSIWVGMTGEYRLAKIRPDTTLIGDTLVIIERAHDPVPVTAEEQRVAFESDRGVSRLLELGVAIDRSLVPDTKPVFTRFEVSEEGEVWVWLSARQGETSPIDVFGADGSYLRTVRTPEDLSPRGPRPVIGRDYLVGIVEDSLGVQSVVRYRIERSVEVASP
jgi:hypothetical protein